MARFIRSVLGIMSILTVSLDAMMFVQETQHVYLVIASFSWQVFVTLSFFAT